MEKMISFFKNKVFLIGTILLLCFISLFVFRFSLVNTGIKFFLQKSLSSHDKQTIHFESVHVDKDRILIRGLHCIEPHYDLRLDRIECTLLNHWKWFFSFMKKGKKFPVLLSLLAQEQKSIKLDIDYAELQIQGEKYYLQYKSSENIDEIGTFFIFQQQNLLEDPLVQIRWIFKEDQIFAKIFLQQIPTKHFLHFLSISFPSYAHQFSSAQGLLEFSGEARFTKSGNFIDFSSQFSTYNLDVINAETQARIAADKIVGMIQYKPEREGKAFWQKMLGSISVEKGTFSLGEPFVLTDIEGVINLDSPHSVLNAKGLLAVGEHPLEMFLQSNESMQKNRVNAFNMTLQLKNKQSVVCNTTITACHDEDQWNLQITADQLFPEQVSLLKTFIAQSHPDVNLFEITKGIFGGKVIALVEKGKFTRFELEKFWGQNVQITLPENPHPIFLHAIKGEGEWSSLSPQWLGELNLQVMVPTSHLLFVSFHTLKEIFHENPPQGNANISTKFIFKKDGVDTQGSIILEDKSTSQQSLQFGILSTAIFPRSFLEIREGWLRASHFSENFYLPFIKTFSPDIELHGEMEFVATYDGKQVECSFYIQDFLAKHYLFDVKAEYIGTNDFKKIQKEIAKVFFYPESGMWEGKIPLVNAMVYDRRLGLFCTNVMAEVCFSLSQDVKEIKGEVNNGNVFFDGNPLLEKLQCSFLLANEDISLAGLSSKLLLPTDRDICLLAPEIFLGEKKQSQCKLQLYDGSQLLAHFEGIKTDQWVGKLAFGLGSPIEGNFSIQCTFDPLQELLTLDADTTSFKFLGKEIGKVETRFTKLGKDIFIDKISWDNCTLKSSLSPENGNWIVNDLEISKPEMCMKGEGRLYCDLPTSTHDLLLKADLNINIELFQPMAMQFKTKEPVKIAFSPETGLVISHLDLSLQGGDFLLEHGEYLFPFNKISAHKCTFSLSEEFLNTLIKAQIVPEIGRNLHIFKHFSGGCNFVFSPQEKKVIGWCNDAITWPGSTSSLLQFETIIQENALSVALKEENLEESLHIQGKWEKGKLSLEKIMGNLGPLSASLKHSKGLLKGSLEVDFANLSSLLNLPINSWISLWNLGKGFKLEGEFTPHPQLQDWEFKGKIKGKDCVCAGYPLQTLEAKIELQPGQIIIENLDINDEAGKLWINDGILTHNKDQWIFSFPLVEIRNVHPQMFYHAKELEKQVFPLKIKTASITELRGVLDKLSSVTGQGALRFSVKDKTKFSFLKKIPYELLQRIGWEENLFIPVGGEIDFVIREGKIFLQSLKGVQSEKKRSEFFLPKGGEQPYVDFQGNLFMNLKIRQFINPSQTEPISLDLRGTWNEPELSIK